MGHERVGRLPKTRLWSEVIGLLESAPEDTSAIARATLLAAEGRLDALRNDPSLRHCFWLLVRLTWAARAGDFRANLAELGLHVREDTPAIAFLSQISDIARSELSRHTESGPFSELASLALRRSLAEAIGQQGANLLGSTVDTLREGLKAYSNKEQFGRLARRFFSDLLSRTLRNYLDKELSNHIGSSHSLKTIDDSAAFNQAVDLHVRQTAAIMEGFAADWYSKNQWRDMGRISRERAARFVPVALDKIRADLKLQAG